MWGGHGWRVHRTTGLRAGPRVPTRVAGAEPIKMSDIARSAANKILSGDHNWHGNRPAEYPRNMWHNFRGQRRNNVLFGYSHVQFFKFPREIQSDPGYGSFYSGALSAVPEKYRPDSGFLYW